MCIRDRDNAISPVLSPFTINSLAEQPCTNRWSHLGRQRLHRRVDHAALSDISASNQPSAVALGGSWGWELLRRFPTHHHLSCSTDYMLDRPIIRSCWHNPNKIMNITWNISWSHSYHAIGHSPTWSATPCVPYTMCWIDKNLDDWCALIRNHHWPPEDESGPGSSCFCQPHGWIYVSRVSQETEEMSSREAWELRPLFLLHLYTRVGEG